MGHPPRSRGSTASLQSAATANANITANAQTQFPRNQHQQQHQQSHIHSRGLSLSTLHHHDQTQPISSTASNASTADETDLHDRKQQPQLQLQQHQQHHYTYYAPRPPETTSPRYSDQLNVQTHTNAMPSVNIAGVSAGPSSATVDPALNMPQLHTFHHAHNGNGEGVPCSTSPTDETAIITRTNSHVDVDVDVDVNVTGRNMNANAEEDQDIKPNADGLAAAAAAAGYPANDSMHAPSHTQQRSLSAHPESTVFSQPHSQQQQQLLVDPEQEDTCSIDDGRSLSQDGTTATTAMDSQSQRSQMGCAGVNAIALANGNLNAGYGINGNGANAAELASQGIHGLPPHFNQVFYENRPVQGLSQGHSHAHSHTQSQSPSLGDAEMSGIFPQRDFIINSGVPAPTASTTASLSSTMLGGNSSKKNQRKKKGAASSAANDTELRRLLREYDSYTLKQMAHEVQKHDGNGGRAEKVKQVFAMLWLRENCRKDTGSVRRDRVYCAYADRCGNERVSVLNPASFGKLVRIIFPNVQTRRLGVRGESKYHYVDLTLNETSMAQAQVQSQQGQGQQQKQQSVVSAVGKKKGSGEVGDCDSGEQSEMQEKGAVGYRKSDSMNIDSTLPNVQSQAVQPGPFARPPQLPTQQESNTECPCNQSNSSVSDLSSNQNPLRRESQFLIERMLQFTSSPEPQPTDNETLQLPNIHPYLPPGTDPDAADALSALYRTHCISAIDNFRFCKEKNLLRQFTALAGTLTVPVHKLFVHPSLVNWVEECDWLMYKKMLSFVSPLTTQVVPDPVLNAFASISRGLVAHIRTTLKSHPEHVQRARIVPAMVFCQLLRRFLDVNQAANAAAAWLCHSDNRAKMWEEYDALIDAEEVVGKAKVPGCSVDVAVGIIEVGAKALLVPLATMGLGVEGLYDNDALRANGGNGNGNIDEMIEEEELSLGAGLPSLKFPSIQDNPFPDRWTAFLQQLPNLFPNHSARCVLDKVESIWGAILRRLTLGGAQSFSAWWMAQVFFVEMISWQSEKEGFLASSSPEALRNRQVRVQQPREAEPSELETVAIDDLAQGHTHPATAGKDVPISNGNGVNMNGNSTGSASIDALATIAQQTPTAGRSARSSHFGMSTMNNDDSAIDLGDDSILQSANGISGMNTPTGGIVKYRDMLASDAVADADGDVVVV